MSTEAIRNFSIIAHIDHGKSTLADRLLELTGVLKRDSHAAQYLDSMELERERGITIKMQPVTMQWPPGQDAVQNSKFTLNLIDTPGHMDFAYEVERSLAAVEGALLLVDASQGIQAQTLANLNLARENNLVIVGVVNKIDLPSAASEETARELARVIGQGPEQILKISAKNGLNVEQVLAAIIKRVPPPRPGRGQPRALIFDSHFDSYKGVVAHVRVVDGRFQAQQPLALLHGQTQFRPVEVGVFAPRLTPCPALEAGHIGYVATGLKEPGRVRVGDTVAFLGSGLKAKDGRTRPLPGYRESQPVVFANFFPGREAELPGLAKALAELRLNDAALRYEPAGHPAFGKGFRVGLLGMLHLEITLDRLQREHAVRPIVTNPSVAYHVYKKEGQRIKIIHSATELPAGEKYLLKEPWVKLVIVIPPAYLGRIMKLMERYRSIYQNTDYLSPERVRLTYQAPLADIIVDFIDTLKSATEGFGSMSYQLLDWRAAHLVKLEILIQDEVKEAFSRILPAAAAFTAAKRLLAKLKQALPPQNFAQKLQARAGGRIIARETIRALAKNVIAPLYGGDYTRKKKLLVKQRKGKRRLEKIGRVHIPEEVYLKTLKR